MRNLDGIPSDVRDKTNRPVLDKQFDADGKRAEEIRKRIVELDARPFYHPGRYISDPIERRRLRTEQTTLNERLTGAAAIKERLANGGLLLGYEPAAGNGRAIVATGNPDTADTVVTFVPGTGAHLGGIAGDLARVDRMAESARAADPGKNTVGITWYGYDAPQFVGEAGYDSYADQAAPQLRSFQEGLRATHVGAPSRNTVIGHSYGSTVVGHTARDGTLDADAVVFVGSPGVGVDKAGDLTGLPSGAKVYSTTSEGDEIWWVRGIHGTDPSSPEFGAIIFRADPNGGHSDYWTNVDGRPNPSLISFGRIVVGKDPVP